MQPDGIGYPVETLCVAYSNAKALMAFGGNAVICNLHVWENAKLKAEKSVPTGMSHVVSSPFLRSPSLPPFAAHSSGTQPIVCGDIKNRASGAPQPPSAVTVFAFTQF
jgi:hypothetical protein